jgi:hypothetical protein
MDKTNSIPIEKIAELANQLGELSETERISPTEAPVYVKQKIEEKQRIQEEIQKARTILEQKKVDIQTIEEYKKLEEELMKYGLSVVKKVDNERISYSRAAFALMDGIDTTNKMTDARKQLNDTLMQIQMVNLFSARQNDALNALMKLQSCGVTIEEILNIYGILNSARSENARINPSGFPCSILMGGMDQISARQNDAINGICWYRLFQRM